jgi:hypothetical protein
MKIYLSYFLVSLAFVFISTSVCAEENPKYIDGEKIKLVDGGNFLIGSHWSDSTKSELIGGSVTKKDRILSYVVDEIPLFSWMRYPINNAANFKKMGKIIAKYCKDKFPENVMSAISCVANSVKTTLAVSGWPSSSTFCRAHATAFRASFESLEIPRSFVKDMEGSTTEGGHVVSSFILTSTNGQIFSYVIDAGNLPSKVFPNTDATAEWHKKNKGNPKFSFTEQPQYQFTPASQSGGVR